jgi:histidinol-phosphate aminotransferase
VNRRPADADRSSIRPALAELVPYEPGKPVEEVQRELGLERVVKLASNEGPYGPFPAAQEAIERATRELNRYPDGGAWRLRHALADLHGVAFENVTVCAGADAVIGFVCLATLDPGDEVVTGWPSFPSYVLDPLKLGAVPVRVPLRDERFDLDAILAAVTRRTKLVFIAAPNNPTGTTNSRSELDAYFEQVPAGVLTVLDQAYFEYIDDPEYPDAVEEYAKEGLEVLVLRTFSKIFGLAGLRVGYGIGRADVITAIGKVRRAFDVTSAGQEAALASLAGDDELARRRTANREAMTLLDRALRGHGLEPPGPAVANFEFVRVGDAVAVSGALLRQGVIVRPMGSFGAPDALRITAGTPEEIAFLERALDAVPLPGAVALVRTPGGKDA